MKRLPLWVTIWKYEGLQLMRSPSQVILLLLAMAGGILAIHHGKSQMDAQGKNLETVRAREAVEWNAVLKGFTADTSGEEGKGAYRKAALPSSGRWWHGYYASWEPSALSSLSIGQRDLYPYYFRLSGQSFYLQLFQNEIAHPQKLRAGHLDLAFILIYLFPLLIIALGYNLLASERERGTYPILRIQASSVASVVLRKGLFFLSLVMAMALGLSCYGLAVSGAMDAGDYPEVLSWLGMVAAYVTFWAAVVLLVVSWRKPSGFNALCLLGGWLLMLVVLPSLINILVAAMRPIDQTHLTDLIRRMGIEDTEAEARKAIHEMAEFRPELVAKDSITGPFLMQKGYAAFEENRRRRSKPVVDAYKVEVEMRNRIAEKLNFLNPAVLAQDVLNALARSDLANYWRFQDAMAPFHEEIAEFYIRPLFENRNLKPSELAARPRYVPPPEPNPSRKVLFGLAHMLMLGLAAAVLAWPGLSRETESGGAGTTGKRISADGEPAKPEPRKKETANA